MPTTNDDDRAVHRAIEGRPRASRNNHTELRDSLINLTIALAIGLLIGIERERRKGEGPGRAAAGARTFALVGLLGGLAVATDIDGLLVEVVLVVGLLAAIAHARSTGDDPGLTSEVALVVTCVLGGLAYGHASLAASSGVAVAALLTLRGPIQRFSREIVTERELHDVLIFLTIAVVLFPLVPDRTVGPFDALNPFAVWRLVVLVMAIGGVGYVALRALDPRLGLAVAGLAGGFVSSTATIGSMGGLARRDPQLARPAVAGAVLSTVATVVQLTVVVGLSSPDTLRQLALPLALAGLASAAYGLAMVARLGQASGGAMAPDPGRIFQLRPALTLGAVIGVVVVAAAGLQEWLGDSGVALSALAAGLADAHAAAASAATLVDAGQLSPRAGALAALLGLSTNTLSKAVIAFSTGGRGYGLLVSGGLVLLLVAAWSGELFRLWAA